MGDIFDQIAKDAVNSLNSDTSNNALTENNDVFNNIASDVTNNKKPLVNPQAYVDPNKINIIDNLWNGVKSIPSIPVEMVKSIPDVASNLYNIFTNPRDAFNSGVLENTVKGAGQIGATTAGATIGTGLGTTAGVALAPATFGTSTFLLPPLFTAAGGAIGDLFYNKALQATGSEEPTNLAQDVNKFASQVGAGAGAEFGLKGASTALKQAKPLALAMERKSLGTRLSDYGKAADSRTIVTSNGDMGTLVKTSLNDLIENKKINTFDNPQVALGKVDTAIDTLSNKIQTVIKNSDSSGVKPVVNFDNALKAIYEGDIPADLVESYMQRLSKLDSEMQKAIQSSDTPLAYLQKQKQALGKSWSIEDKVKADFDRAIYTDLKETIEKYVPEVKNLNLEEQKYIIAKPILDRARKIAENKSIAETMRTLGWTTGGITGSTILGSHVAGPAGALVGTGIGLATRAAVSPLGQAILGKTLRTMPSAIDAITPSSNIIAEIFSNPNEQSFIQNMPNSGDKKKMNNDSIKKDVSYVEQEIDQDPYLSTLYEFESGRNPNAKNPTSSAKGGFQFIDSTAKLIGLDDPYDLGKSLVAVRKITDDHSRKFGSSPEILYAAHYLGARVLNKVIKNEKLTEAEQKQVDYLNNDLIPRFMKVYNTKIQTMEV